jgi:hypothetical protein
MMLVKSSVFGFCGLTKMNTGTSLVTVAFVFCLNSVALALTDAELERIGKRVWQNECRGSREGLTSWNEGEDFASLGIGHFIWYPPGQDGPFEESFPKLVKFLSSHGVKTASWMNGDCPWKTRAEFHADIRSERMNELRDMLANTVKLQSSFIADRMHAALPKILDAAGSGTRERVKTNFQRLLSSGAGTFALIDYVNFKGEGTNPKERYDGQGWGLLQVLETMDSEGQAPAAFGRAAAQVLERRVKNSPPARNEAKWLPGWKNRVKAYAE